MNKIISMKLSFWNEYFERMYIFYLIMLLSHEHDC